MRDQYYKLLNIPVNSSQEVIKKAYRKLAKKYHPDVSKVPNAEDKFIEINAAYEFLIRAPKIQKVRNKRTAEYNARKEREYKEWLKNNEERIKNSAKNKAHMNYSDWVDEEGFGSAEEFAVVKLFGCLFSVFVFACILAFAVFITDLLGLYDTLGVGLLVIMSFLFLPCAVLLMTWLEEKRIYQKLKKRIKNSFRK